ncbi:unnamed protein product [Cutaneotrichosporon oleaginosum]
MERRAPAVPAHRAVSVPISHTHAHRRPPPSFPAPPSFPTPLDPPCAHDNPPHFSRVSILAVRHAFLGLDADRVFRQLAHNLVTHPLWQASERPARRPRREHAGRGARGGGHPKVSAGKGVGIKRCARSPRSIVTFVRLSITPLSDGLPVRSLKTGQLLSFSPANMSALPNATYVDLLHLTADLAHVLLLRNRGLERRQVLLDGLQAVKVRSDLGSRALQLIDARHQEPGRDLAVLLNVVHAEGSCCRKAEKLLLAGAG